MYTRSSVRFVARLAGLLSLVTLAAGIFAEFGIVDSVIVSGDAAATAKNILAAEPLYRLGFAALLVDYTVYLAVTIILYGVLERVSKTLSMLAAAASLIATAIVASTALYYLAPLALLGGAPSLNAFEANQLQAMAFFSFKLRALGANIGLIFFGFHLLFIGWLIARSTFLPRLLGVLSIAGGLCFLLSSFAAVLSPPFAAQLLPHILAPAVLAQASLALWLLVMSVNAERWSEKASAAAA